MIIRHQLQGRSRYRLPFLSLSKENFQQAAQHYEQSLANCEYKEKLTYIEKYENPPKRTKKTLKK